MKKYLGIAAALFFAACMIQTAGAAAIEYKSLYLEDQDRWQYDYTITNTTGVDIYSFAIWFGSPNYDDTGIFYSDLAINERELGDDMNEWNDIINGWNVGGWNMSSFMGNIIPGQIIAESLDPNSTWLAPGDFLELSISFAWLGNGTPASQYFELFGSNYSDLGSGFASPAGDTQPVPEPGTLALMGTGLAGLAAYYRRNRKQ